MKDNKEKELTLIKHIQAVVEQMKIDDIENSPDAASEEFQCLCCGKHQPLAGSMIYGNNLYCNDCVLLTEISLALNKISNPEEMIQIMADKRFDNIYHSIFGKLEESPN